MYLFYCAHQPALPESLHVACPAVLDPEGVPVVVHLLDHALVFHLLEFVSYVVHCCVPFFPLVMFLLYTSLLTIAILSYNFFESFLQHLGEGQLVSICCLARGIGLDLFYDNTLCEVSLGLLEWLMIQLSRQDVAQREIEGYSSYSRAPNDSRSSSGVCGFCRTFVSAYMSLSSGSSRDT